MQNEASAKLAQSPSTEQSGRIMSLMIWRLGVSINSCSDLTTLVKGGEKKTTIAVAKINQNMSTDGCQVLPVLHH